MTDFVARTAIVAARPAPPARFGFFALLGLRRQRRALAKLDASQLADIGVSDAEAAQEAARPVWDVPQHWRA